MTPPGRPAVRVLGIEVEPPRLRRWGGWLAPARQPFFGTATELAGWGQTAGAPVTDRQQRDTYQVYKLTPGLQTCWLTESRFAALPATVRADLVRAQHRHGRASTEAVRAWVDTLGDEVRTQAGGYRFVWWPSLLRGRAAAVLPRVVEADQLPSRHAEVAPRTWAMAARWLPNAAPLAGTFADTSGPNCFGTVMAAAGVRGAHRTWMQREPFEGFLAGCTRPGGRDEDPGTVLIWRDTTGAVQHAAVSLGDDWVLHKPSQSWMSPRVVLTSLQVKTFSRSVGWHLTRRTVIR